MKFQRNIGVLFVVCGALLTCAVFTAGSKFSKRPTLYRASALELRRSGASELDPAPVEIRQLPPLAQSSFGYATSEPEHTRFNRASFPQSSESPDTAEQPTTVRQTSYEPQIAEPAQLTTPPHQPTVPSQQKHGPATLQFSDSLSQISAVNEANMRTIGWQEEHTPPIKITDWNTEFDLPTPKIDPQIEARAHDRIEYGKSLARRNSLMAAREEFTMSLLLIAKSYNTSMASGNYSDHLTKGLIALDEAGDFVNPVAGGTDDSILRQKIRAHTTKLISPDRIDNHSKTKAVDIYCGFAQTQIQQSLGPSVAASDALHSLGKIESRIAENDRSGNWIGQARALVFFRAAMNCDPANAQCANDLGVLLYHMGRLEEAKHTLKTSLVSSPTQLTWENLAAVHAQSAVASGAEEEKAEQLRLAGLAAMEAEKFGPIASENSFAGQSWASTNEFNNNAAFPNVSMQPKLGDQARPSDRKASRTQTFLQKVKGWY